MAGDGHLEYLSRELIGEVEALAPAPLVEQGGQLVVGVDESGVAGVPSLHALGAVVMQIVVGVNPLAHFDVSLLLLHRELGEDLEGTSYGVGPEQAVHCHHRHSQAHAYNPSTLQHFSSLGTTSLQQVIQY